MSESDNEAIPVFSNGAGGVRTLESGDPDEEVKGESAVRAADAKARVARARAEAKAAAAEAAEAELEALELEAARLEAAQLEATQLAAAELAIEEPEAADAEAQAAESAVESAEAEPADAAKRTRRFVPRFSSRPFSLGLLGAVIAVVVFVAAIVGVVLSQLQVHHQTSLNAERAAALTAARKDAVDITTYDYKSLNQQLTVVGAESTASFKATFAQSASESNPLFQKFDATAKATVSGAGISSITSSRAVVLVFVSQTTTNNQQKSGPSTDRSGLQLTLLRQSGRWLLDGVDLL